MISIIKDAAGSMFPLTQRNIGEFEVMKGRGSQFHTEVFDAEGAGSLCIMEMKAAAGMMRMETGVFSPTQLDGPIFSFDYIRAAGKETLFLELYDTTLSHPDFARLSEVKDKYAHVPEHDPGTHWYDSMRLSVSAYKKGRKIKKDAYSMMRDYSEMYFRLLAGSDTCNAEEKKTRNGEFARGLLDNGGPAVNTFRKMVGDERTEEFLMEYMFCGRSDKQ